MKSNGKAKFRLRYLNGAFKGQKIDIAADSSYVVGRDPRAEICLDELNVSWRHGQFDCDGASLIVEDLNSTNGIFVNGLKIGKKVLLPGDTITVGATVFRLCDEKDSDSGEWEETTTDEDYLIARDEPALKNYVIDAVPEVGEVKTRIESILTVHTEKMIKESLRLIFGVLPVTRLSMFKVDSMDVLSQAYTLKQTGISSDHMSHTFAAKVLEKGQALLIEDGVDANPEEWGMTLREQNVRSIIGVPILIEGKTKAVILCDNLDNPSVFVSKHVQILEFVSKAIELLYQRDAISKLKSMTSLLPICAECRRIRDDRGYWDEIEAFIHTRAELNLTHGLCPPCQKKLLTEAGLNDPD